MSDKTLALSEAGLATVVQERGVAIRSLGELMQFSRMVANSGLAPKDFKTPESIMLAVQHGLELGLSPLQALQGTCVINGRVTIFGDLALAIVKSHPACEDVIEKFENGKDDDAKAAICEVHRKGNLPVVRKFSVGQARKAGLWGKAGPWSQYPHRMLQMRARSWALRDSFPDALKGVGVSEEVRDIEPRRVEARVVSTEIVLPGDEKKEEPKQLEEAPPADPLPAQEELDADGNFKF